MSSIRLYVLGALAEGGEMHGHQLRQLAELEHIDQWTDVSVGALYGAIKPWYGADLVNVQVSSRPGSLRLANYHKGSK